MGFLSKLFGNKNAGNETDNVYKTGTLEQVTALIESDAKINTKNKDGHTPLMIAAYDSSSPDVIGALIKAGADINAKNKDGLTPLFYAAQHNPNPEVIGVLIKAGADINAKDKDGATPLFFAAQDNPNPDVIGALIKAGADINAKNKDGVTPLFFAAKKNQYPEVIIALIKAGADVNAKSMANDGHTPLMFAAAQNPNPEVIAVLIKAGADVNATNKDGFTPLFHAAQHNPNPDMIIVLIKAGADVNEKSKVKNGLTPLMSAAAQNPNPAEVIAVLINTGADVNAMNEYYMTPLDFAHSLKNSCAERALIESGGVTGETLANQKRQREEGDTRQGMTDVSTFDDLTVKLKSSDSAERRNAAETLGANKEIGKNTRSTNDNQKLDKAERDGYAVEIVCENCGRVCKASPRLISRGTIMVMTPEIAIIASRYCERCNIVVCGACVGVSLNSTGQSFGGRRCPKCGEETDYAAACHLRMTDTKLK